MTCLTSEQAVTGASLLPWWRREELNKLGPLSLNEKITAGALGTTVLLWIFGGSLGIGNVGAALLGLSVLLITNVVTWKECLSNNQVWGPSLPGCCVLPKCSRYCWRHCCMPACSSDSTRLWAVHLYLQGLNGRQGCLDACLW